MRETLWDCVIVGAGPAGLSAAIYMGRFLRRTLVLDDCRGRWSYGQTNENYLGFPRGIGARRLRDLGHVQARRFGVSFEEATVRRVSRDEAATFVIETNAGRRRARTIIWAAGVEDIWPGFAGARAMVGKRLFWCIVCDGWRTLGKTVLLIGRNESAARTTLQFLTYTSDLTFVLEPGGPVTIGAAARRKLEAERISVRTSPVRSARAGTGGVAVRFEDGTCTRYDYVFSLLGAKPRTGGLDDLQVPRSRTGFIRVDDKNRTQIPGFFAAGDVTDKHSHQVASAAHEGAMAAQAANFVLYPPRQRLK